MLLRIGPEVRIGACSDSLTVLGYSYYDQPQHGENGRTFFAYQVGMEDGCGEFLSYLVKYINKQEELKVLDCIYNRERTLITILFSREAEEVRDPENFLRATKRVLERIVDKAVDEEMAKHWERENIDGKQNFLERGRQ